LETPFTFKFERTPPARTPKQLPTVNVKREYSAREFAVYLKCSLEYEYRYVLGLFSPRSDTPMEQDASSGFSRRGSD
jgi:hypothetical protein